MSTHTGLKRRIAVVSVVGIALIAFSVVGLHAEASRGVTIRDFDSLALSGAATGSGGSVGGSGDFGTVSGGSVGGSGGSLAVPAQAPVAVPVQKTTAEIFHETLDPLGVDWGMGCGDLTGAWAITTWNPTWIFNHYLVYSDIKICVSYKLPASQAHFVALHEYGHYLQYRLAASQSPFLSHTELDARLGESFDTSGNTYSVHNLHLELLADCEAKLLNGGQWETGSGYFNSDLHPGSGYYTKDCTAEMNTAAAAILQGQLP
jgi:hypothetical protein